MTNEKPIKGLLLGDALYTKMKFFVQILIPAISSLYFGLGTIWNFPAVDKVTGSLAILATFFGGILGLSTRTYNAANSKYDGMIFVKPHEDGTTFTFRIDPNDLVDKKELRLKVGSDSQSDEGL